MSKYDTAPILINKKPENFVNRMEIDRDAFIKAANELNKNEFALYLLLMGTKDGYGISQQFIENCTGIDDKHLPGYRKTLVEKGYINYKPYSYYEVLGYQSNSKTHEFCGYNITGDTKDILILKSLLIECDYRAQIMSYLFDNSPLNKNQIPEIELLIDKFKLDNVVPYYIMYKTLHGKVFRQKEIKSFNHLKNAILHYLKINVKFTIDSESNTENHDFSAFSDDKELNYEPDINHGYNLIVDNSTLPF